MSARLFVSLLFLFLSIGCSDISDTEGFYPPSEEQGIDQSYRTHIIDQRRGSGGPPSPTGGERSPVVRGVALENTLKNPVSVGTPETKGNLTIFPLYLKKTVHTEEFVALEDALEEGTVEVSEVSEGGSVNTVTVKNKGSRPVYGLAGTVIIGGKQDRILTKDVVVLPKKTVKVKVCCVEQGRWSPRRQLRSFSNLSNTNLSSGLSFHRAAPAKSEAALKRIVQESEPCIAQGAVWRKVSESCSQQRVSSPTGTYNELIEKTEKTVVKYLHTFKQAFGEDDKICGFLVFINGKPDSCDLFASPKLLALFKESLLRGYVLDALNAKKTDEFELPSLDAAKNWIRNAFGSPNRRQTVAENGERRVERIEGERTIGFLNYIRNRGGDETIFHMNLFFEK